jgi:O-methyltransferase involved in polyketide biosynthesis
MHSTRRTFISASILNPSWIEKVKTAGSRPIMFVAEGVLSYLTEQQVKQIFALLIEHFPGCFFAFDSISSLTTNNNKKPKDKTKYYLPQRQWAIKNIREIQTWDSRYQVKKAIKYGNLAFKYYWRKGIFQGLRHLSDRFVKNSYRLSLTLVKLGKASF